MSTRARPAKSTRELEREWWLRTLEVLRHPREPFEALRDDSDEAAQARQEPMTALVFVSGIAIFLSLGETAGRLYDDLEFDWLLVMVQSVIAGLLVAVQNFWIVGGALHLGVKAADGEGRYRQARHIVGLATAPFLLSLVLVFPVRLALFGSDMFRSGGDDARAAGDVFRGFDVAFFAWALALVVLGIRTVYRLSWRKTAFAAAMTGLFAALTVALFVVL